MRQVTGEPPHDLAAEAAVLSTLLVDQRVHARTVSDLLPSREQFYSEAHARVFEAILALESAGTPVDVASVGSRLRTTGRLEQVGGMIYLTQLLNAAPAMGEQRLRAYAQIVRDAWVRRRFAHEAQESAALCYQPVEDVNAFISERVARIVELEKAAAVSASVVSLEAASEASIACSQKRATGFSSGFQKLDWLTAGLRPGKVTIVGARTSVGKSAFALQVSRNVAVQGAGVLYASLEMSSKSLASRLLCAEAKIDSYKLQTGTCSDDDHRRLLAAHMQLRDYKIQLLDSQAQSLSSIKAAAQKAANKLRIEKTQLGLIVIDYIGLVKPSSAAARRNREQEVAETSRGLRALAVEFNCAVMGLAQINRDAEKRVGADRMPKLHDLRDSGSIEQDADVVILLHRARDQQGQFVDDVAECAVAKNREGPIGHFQLRVEPQFTSFSEIVEGGDV